MTEIGSKGFADCKSLEYINIPANTNKIGAKAFEKCKSLKSIIIPSKVTEMGTNVFVGCASLTSIAVEDGNTVYDSRGNCNAIINTETNVLLYGCKNTIIPNTITGINSNAFYGN